MKTLSDKAIKDFSNNPIPNYYWEKDVKEAIKKLMARFPNTESVHCFTGEQFRFAIKEIFGEELVE